MINFSKMINYNIKSLLFLLLIMVVSPIWGQLNNTTFTYLSSGTRDSSADKGAIYYLDGNTTNGRLNIGDDGIWIVGDNTHILVNGNANHSYMRGIIRATGLVYIGKPSGGGRLDFSSPIGGLQTTDLTYVYLGSGEIYNHLESDRNIFNGFTRFVIDMASGSASIQFSDKEYKNIALDIKSTNNATLNIYPAREHTGFTSLPGFRTKNISALTLVRGTTATSHGRIYDPVYEGVANNLISLQVEGFADAGNHGKEYFTIDVTAIRHDDAKIRVVDGASTVQISSDALTVSNTTIYANDGVTPLTYYNGKNVIPCLVRTIGNTQSSSRNTISYIIRRNGYREVSSYNLAMNTPVVISEMVIDENWSNTATITEISNLDELYDEAQKWLTNNLDTENFLSVNAGKLIMSDWNLVLDKNASAVFVGNSSSKTITIKSTTLSTGVKFSSLQTSGTVSINNGAELRFGYEDTTGINKFVHLEWNNSTTTLDVEIENLDTNTSIISSSATQIYKGHFLIPSPVPSTGIRANVKTNGFTVYQEIIPDDVLTFVRENITLNASESRQKEMITLSKKLLQKTEAINNAINGVTPSFNGTITTTASSASATIENQEALLTLLKQILLKVTASRNSLD